MLKTIGHAVKWIKDSYKRKQESEEKGVWECIKDNPKFFFHYTKSKRRLHAPISPFNNNNGKLIKEKP